MGVLFWHHFRSMMSAASLLRLRLFEIDGGVRPSDLDTSSKAALNMLMKGYAAHRPSDHRAPLLVAPGWVRTDIGGSEARLSVEESIPLVVDMIAANSGKPGLRFVDRFNNQLPW